jgi:RNA recognition motif-containing protein
MEVQQQNQQMSSPGTQFEPGKIFVGGLSWDTNEASMQGHFQQFGTVKDCVVMRDPDQDPGIRKNRGFGFVTFEDSAAVAKVLAMPVHIVDGKNVDPKAAVLKGGPVSGGDTKKKVFLGGLASQTTEQEVRNYFESRYGTVTDVDFKKDKDTSRLRGFGFVAFETEEVRNEVVKLHYHEICGKRVEAKKAEPRGAPVGGAPTQQFQQRMYQQPAYPYHPQAAASNGQYQQYYGGGASNQYYGYQQQSGYGPQYSTGGSYPYDHSGYPRTQTSAGDRPADPHQSYYQTQHTYGHSGAQQMGTGYTQESAAYGRSAYPTTQDTGYNQQLASYGQAAAAAHQQQQPPQQTHHYGGGAGVAGNYGH